MAICLGNGQTRAIGVPLSTATMGSAAGIPPRRGRQLRRRTTSSSGRRLARALHSAAVRDSGSRRRSGHAEGEDDRRRLLLAQVERGTNRIAIGEPVRARGETLVPCGEQHVLRGTAGVERDGPLARHDDRDDEPRAEDVPRGVDTRRERLDPLAALDDDERPRLPVGAGAGQAPCVEDAGDDLLGQRPGSGSAAGPYGSRSPGTCPPQ